MKLYSKRTTVLMATLLTVFLIALSGVPTWAWQASPPGTAEMSLNGKKVSITYSRPSIKGRKIMGELVPYGQVWRMGANQATTLTTEADLVIGGFNLPKGSYTLWALPSATSWKLIINKRTGIWGTPYREDYKKDELTHLDLKVEKTASPVEQMTISLDKTATGGLLKLEWETTRVSIPFTEKK